MYDKEKGPAYNTEGVDYVAAISDPKKENAGSMSDQLFSSVDANFWKEFDAGGLVAAPFAYKGALYVGSNDNCLYALRASDGSILWEFESNAAVASCPFVWNDIVYFKSHDKNLYALSAKDGALLWKFAMNFDTFCFPIVNSGILYVGGGQDQNLYAINAMDGRLVWKFRANGGIDLAPAIVNDTVFFGCRDKNLYALTLNGELRWKFLANEGIDSSPAIADMDGNEVWSYNNAITEKVKLQRGIICFGCWDGHVYALDLNGKELWRFRTNKPIVYSSPAIRKGVVYVGSFDRHLYAINLDGSLKWKFETDGIIATDPVISGDTIYIGSMDKNLYAISLEGDLKWKFLTGGWVIAPAEVYNGVVYFGSYDSIIYAISEKTQKVMWKFQSLGTYRPDIIMKTQMLLERIDTLSKRVMSLWMPSKTPDKSKDMIFSDHISVSPMYRSASPYASSVPYKHESPYASGAPKKKNRWPFELS